MNTKKPVKRLFILLVILVAACTEQNETLNRLNMTLAAEMSLLPATVWVAENQGYFEDEGLDLSIREFDSGRNALETMLTDKGIDIATVAQTPIVFNSFNKEDFVIIATMAHSIDDVKVLSRKDHGIHNAKDIVGKKVGVTLRSTGHYFFEGFLANHDLTLSDVDLYDTNAAQLKSKLISGELDAITSWEPHIYNTQKMLDESKLTMLISPVPFRKDFFFTVNKAYAVDKKEQIKRFLNALLRAETFIKNNQEESQKIISHRINADLEIVSRIWDSFTFEITLEQSIIVSLEDEAKWAKEIGVSTNDAPNYLNFINDNNLKNIKPEAVNIFH